LSDGAKNIMRGEERKKMRKILLVRLVELSLVPHLAASLVQYIILD
jgi:hypothetical protein